MAETSGFFQGMWDDSLRNPTTEAEALKENLKSQLEAANRKTEEYERLREQAIKQIEEIAGMTAVEAKNQLMESMKAEASPAMAFCSCRAQGQRRSHAAKTEAKAA